MNSSIDPKLNIFWSANLKSEKTWFDKLNQDGAEWFKLSEAVESGEEEIQSMALWVHKKFPHSHITSVPIGQDKDGYFFGKRASIAFGDGNAQEFIGAGYLENDIVKITWYNNLLEAIMFEERSPQDCGFSLIRCKNKNTTATSSQV
jgi:hypothetical protein